MIKEFADIKTSGNFESFEDMTARLQKEATKLMEDEMRAAE